MYRRKAHNEQYFAIALSAFAVLVAVSGVGNGVLGNTIGSLNLIGTNSFYFGRSPNKARWEKLFENPKSIGNLAIGNAEGNYTITGEKTSLYHGHDDPGNHVWNSGFCSDQGRGQRLYNRLKRTNNLPQGVSRFDLADQECIRYISQDFNLINQNMVNAGLDPQKNIEVVINAVDLRNQASPDTHPRFIKRYVEALGKNSVTDKVTWARIMAFRTRRWTATGLLNICRRENRPVSDFGCIEMDQKRRAIAIRSVLRNKGIN